MLKRIYLEYHPNIEGIVLQISTRSQGQSQSKKCCGASFTINITKTL